MTSFVTKPICDWLSIILYERYGVEFKIRISDSFLKLSLVNDSSRYIIFTDIQSGFYGFDSIRDCHIWDSNCEGFDSILKLPHKCPSNKPLVQPVIQMNGNFCYINYDILGLVYWMLNRIEEIDNTNLDNHGRFPAVSSHAYNHDYLNRPIVDEWLDILRQVIIKLWPNISLSHHTPSLHISHDVDLPSRYGFASFPNFFKRFCSDVINKNFKTAIISPYTWLMTKNRISIYDSYNSFDFIMDISDSFNIKSSFYFICGKTSSLDAEYKLTDLPIRNLLLKIYNRGHEIGLHPSYNSFQSTSIILDEISLLRNVMFEEDIEQEDIGGRMHYLRFSHPDTIQSLNNVGLKYDSTLGYADLPGFRCGTCFDYQAFNPKTQEILQIRIKPLIAMECTIIDDRYMGLGTGIEAYNEFTRLKQICYQVNGCFTLLWHNNRLDKKQEKSLYVKVVSYLNECEI